MTFLPCTAVLFDCDGVLVDSDASVLRSWRRWATELGLDPGVVLAAVHGRRAADTVAHFVAPDARGPAVALIDRLEIDDAPATTAIPGAATLLAAVPASRWAAVTSGTPALARARLVAAGLPVPEVFVTAADVAQGKPHPEGYLAAASALDVDPAHCVVLEDAAAGIRAARAAGVAAVIGVGNRPLGDDRPDVLVPDLRRVRWTGSGLETR